MKEVILLAQNNTQNFKQMLSNCICMLLATLIVDIHFI